MSVSSGAWEVAASVYPWDLHDEGVNAVLDNLQEKALVNSVYLVGLMHPEPRPWGDNDFPHNPVRKRYMPEDSRVYWHPQPRRFGRITPELSDRAFLRDHDWLEVLMGEATRRNIRKGLEISHTLVGAERALAEFPDCVQRDINGEPLAGLHVDGALPFCFNNPDVSEYIVALFSDVVERYNVDYVQSCMIPYPMPVPFLKHEYDSSRQPHMNYPGFPGVTNHQWPRRVSQLGGCFCDNCRAAAESRGIDLPRIRAVLKKALEDDREVMGDGNRRTYIEEGDTSESGYLVETPELLQWLVFRCESVAAMYGRIHKAVHEIKPEVDLRLNLYVTTHPEYAGLDLRRLRSVVDGVRTSNYSECLGDPLYLDQKRQFLNGVQRVIYEKIPLYSGTGVKSGATRETIIEGIRLAWECRAAGITLGHYDAATFERLEAVGEGLRLLGAAGGRPANDKRSDDD
jgi:hypothetical protein